MLNPKSSALLALLALSGCGFTPLYGGSSGADVSTALENVRIPVIPDRAGQLLHQALEQDFYRSGQPTEELYALSVSYNITKTGEGVQEDSSTTRTRFVAVARWSLSPIGQPTRVLTSGTATVMDALNVIDQQYFATDMETQTIDQQLADEASAQITAQLASWFHAHLGS